MSGTIRLTLMIVTGALALGFVLAAFVSIDRVVTGAGQLVTHEPTVVVQSLNRAIIKSINVKAGDRVRAGDLLATLDSTFAEADVAQLEVQVGSLNAEIARLEAELDEKPFVAEGLEERPDSWYEKGVRLPGGLETVHAPGPTEVHFAFLLRRRRALFCADVLLHDGDRLRFVEGSHQDEPERTRVTARKLLRLPFDVLCPAHGAPVFGGARRAIRAALRADARTD